MKIQIRNEIVGAKSHASLLRISNSRSIVLYVSNIRKMINVSTCENFFLILKQSGKIKIMQYKLRNIEI